MAGGDRAIADLNTSVLDGQRLTLGELRHACDAVPFLSDRRMVIVNGLLHHLVKRSKAGVSDPGGRRQPAWKKTFLKELADYLPELPRKTRLLFVESESLKMTHPIVKLALAQGKAQGAHVKEFKVPKESNLPGWIARRVRKQGGDLSRTAAGMLAQLVGADMRLLDQEIDKLLVYADGRQVTGEDVQALVSRAREAVVFDLVDAIGHRQAARALELQHQLIDDGEAPLFLLAMLGRQVRLLIQIKELQAQGVSQPELTKTLKLHPYVVGKVLSQIPRFSMAQLEKAHERLVDTDWAIKTGRMNDKLALDLLVVELTSA
jgi:DNA polymerase-3 subunit delta